MTHYACPIWSFAARTYAGRLIQRKCFSLVTSAPYYVRSWDMHEDLVVTFFVDVSALTETSESKLADMKIPLVRKIGRYLLIHD